ncbi:hypothetical protein WR25_04977 [Diploscapter pachys]|uniref:Uncharacterized protein n=1 Tax=Diploscapter pachys TaxID=2018661 RepID=A0A2A2J4G7_9BILA|nr:hypothetical protein WR25_04977 [Diploscapter pachys]
MPGYTGFIRCCPRIPPLLNIELDYGICRSEQMNNADGRFDEGDREHQECQFIFSSKINTREESSNVEEQVESLVASAHQPEEHPVCVVQVENRRAMQSASSAHRSVSWSSIAPNRLLWLYVRAAHPSNASRAADRA